jgi:hypothetical protein
MRRLALLLLPALLAGCATTVGNPADGLGGFLGNTLSLSANPNRPVVESPNALRVMGAVVEVEPLETEPGNVWPGPLPPARTMSDMQREMSGLPPIDAPRSTVPVGSSAPPPPPPSATTPLPRPQVVRPPPPVAPAQVPAAVGSRVLQTPAGPAITNIGSNGVETYTLPSGRTGIVMPNANGTLTLIGPDGTTQTIAAPR